MRRPSAVVCAGFYGRGPCRRRAARRVRAGRSGAACVLSSSRIHEPFGSQHMSYNIDLSGRVALVTGASSGLGMQFAKTLAKAGAGVVLAGRRVDRLKALRAEIEADGGDAHVVTLDVTDHDSIKADVAHAETEMGTLDILVNNSGVGRTQMLT